MLDDDGKNEEEEEDDDADHASQGARADSNATPPENNVFFQTKGLPPQTCFKVSTADILQLYRSSQFS